MMFSGTPSRASSSRVGVAQLVRCEAPPDARLGCEAAKLDADPSRRPGVPACRAVDHAEQRPARQLEALLQPGSQLLKAPGVHPDLASATALAHAHEQRSASRIEVALGEVKRLLDAQAAAPQDGDQGAQADTVTILACGAHHGDDLLDGRWDSGVQLTLITRRAASVVTGHRRR